MTLLYTILTGFIAFIAVFSVGYLLMLLTAAALAIRANARIPFVPLSPTNLPHVVVVIPAHNEELVLEATLASLRAQQYPSNKLEVVVVADNCFGCKPQRLRVNLEEAARPNCLSRF